jgi:hypothetical protein
MKSSFRITALLLVMTLSFHLFPINSLAADPRPAITRHPVQVEMESAREIPVVKESKVNWWWVALGVAVAGGGAALLAGGGGGSGGATAVTPVTPATQAGSGSASW